MAKIPSFFIEDSICVESLNSKLIIPLFSMHAKFTIESSTILPASYVTYSKTFLSYLTEKSQLLIPKPGTFLNSTGTSITSPASPLTFPIFTFKLYNAFGVGVELNVAVTEFVLVGVCVVLVGVCIAVLLGIGVSIELKISMLPLLN